MPEHVIRFRGGWEWLDRGPDSATEAVGTPGDAPAHLARRTMPTGRVRLVRTFKGRRSTPSRETPLFLRLESVEGLKAVWLNDRELARPDRARPPFV